MANNKNGNGFVKWFYNPGFGICMALEGGFFVATLRIPNLSLSFLVCFILLFLLNLVMTIWEWYDTDRYYRKYTVKTKGFVIINVLYLLALLCLGIFLFLIALRGFSLWCYAYTGIFWLLDALDIIFCVLFIKGIGEADFTTKVDFISFVFGKDVPGLIVNTFIFSFIVMGIINNTSYLITGLLWTSFLVEVIIGFLSKTIVQKTFETFIPSGI